ncbi:MAG: hypothetical protein LDL19_04615 [Thiobacillus sp.]|nr:hypothetical protein [Thiobacillus sp.]
MKSRLRCLLSGLLAGLALPASALVVERPFSEGPSPDDATLTLVLSARHESGWADRAGGGDAFAQWLLANSLLQSAPQQSEAVAWLKRSAENGLSAAALQWGAMLFYGAGGTSRDPVAGRAWIERAARRGHAEAAYELARIDWQASDHAGSAAWLARAAELGWAPARETLGRMLRRGQALEQDLPLARAWFERAAAQGRPGAKLQLADMLRLGDGGARDDARAVSLYAELAAAGFRHAAHMRAAMIEEGRGAQPDARPLREYLERAAADGNAGAAYELGRGLIEGRFGPAEDAAGVAWLARAADKDHPLAQYWLAWRGNAAEQRATWLARAAALGYTPAEFYYGMAYSYGQGVPADDVQAVEWYRRAADKGYMEAQSSLSWRYLKGKTLPLDEPTGLAWARKAAAQGNELSMQNLVIRLMARGDAAGRDEARLWIERLAQRGSALHQNMLGIIRGGHTPEFGQAGRDHSEALRWWRKAAAQGYAAAELNLGDAYLKGWGVKASAQEARRWYARAAARGNPDAEGKLSELYRVGYNKGVPRDAEKARRHLMLAAQGGSAAAYKQLADWERPDHPWRNPAGGYDWARVRGEARAGNADAQTLIGVAYLQGGAGLPQSLSNAHHWFLKAAVAGNIEAMYHVGRALYTGANGLADRQAAEMWFDKAAQGGHLNAMVYLARMHALGEARKPDPGRALRLIEEAARRNHPDAIRGIAGAYARGDLGLRADPAQAAEWLARLPPGGARPEQTGGAHDTARRQMAQFHYEAWRGTSFRFHDIGMDHELGRGVPVDIAEAARWYRRGVAAGESRAQYRLARLYQSGSAALPRDLAQSAALYRLAAGQGHPDAQLALSDMLTSGQGVPRDEAAALIWLERAAQSGAPDALHRLGFRYLHGRGTVAQPEKAAALCRQAAEAGFDQAQFDLAGFYLRGVGVTRDDAQARFWLQRAAEQGHAEAALGLGRLLMPRDGDADATAQAVAWLDRAARLSNPDAQHELAQILLFGPEPLHDEVRGMRWLEAAAGQGLPAAMLDLARRLEQAGAADAGRAIALYEAVAEQGDLDVQMMLGQRALRDRNTSRALCWFDKAAASGSSQANLVVGASCLSGIGVPTLDDKDCLTYLRRAAEQNDSLAQWLYGAALADRAVDADALRQARVWLLRAQEQGVTLARDSLYEICARQPQACIK